MELLGQNFEFRGLSSKETKEGKIVYNVALETEYNEQVTLYIGENKAKFDGVSKGDKIDLVLEYNLRYGNLSVNEVIKHG